MTGFSNGTSASAAFRAAGRHQPETNLGRVLLQPPDLNSSASGTRYRERIGRRFGSRMQRQQTIQRIGVSRIVESLAPHGERQHQFQIVASLHRSEAAIAFIATVRLTTVMLMTAVVPHVVAGRVEIIVVMISVRVVIVMTVLICLLNRSRDSV